MRDFKKQLIETLLQITVLASIYRYPNRNFDQITNQDINTNTLLLLLNNNQRQFIDFDLNNLKKDLIDNNQLINFDNFIFTRQHNISLYPSFIEFQDKFIDHSNTRQQSVQSNNLQNNEYLSEEDMDAIKRILFEQDIDIGIGKELFDTEYTTNKLTEKNILTDIGLNYQKRREEEKNADILITTELLQHHPLPEGYKLVVEEDTGEIITIPSNDFNYMNRTNSSNAPKFEDNTNIILNETTRNQTNNDNKRDENSIDDFLFNTTFNLTDVKLDDGWFKTFLDTMPPLTPNNYDDQSKSLEINYEQFDLQLNNNNNDDGHATTTVTSSLFDDAIGNNNFEDQNLLDSNFTHIDFENMLTYNSETPGIHYNEEDEALAKQIDNFINEINPIINEEDNLKESIEILDKFTYDHQNTTPSDLNENNDTNSSSSANQRSEILSTTNDDQSISTPFNEFEIKLEKYEDDEAIYAFNHNHTYLENSNDTDYNAYHPHSYKNKIKNILNINNRYSKDEKLIQEYKIEYTLDRIVNSDVDEFNEMIKNPKLNLEQLAIIKDVRRRGKNKIAAQICRKRKIESIDTLRDDVDHLKSKKILLEQERERLQTEMKEFTMKIDNLYKELVGNNQNPNDPIILYINTLLEHFNDANKDPSTTSVDFPDVSTNNSSKSKFKKRTL